VEKGRNAVTIEDIDDRIDAPNGKQEEHWLSGDNPFSPQRIAPGEVSFLLPGNLSAHILFARFEQAGRLGEIVGPEGSGKSTLLHAMMREGDRRGLGGRYLHSASGRLFASPHSPEDAEDTVWYIDDVDRIPRLLWWGLRLACRLVDNGLVVTARRSMGLPTIYRPVPNGALIVSLVRDLAGEEFPLDEEEADALIVKYGGNVRRVLLELRERAASVNDEENRGTSRLR
jgi:hypothetical protein